MLIYKKTLTNITILTAGLMMMATGAMAESHSNYNCNIAVEINPQVCFYTGQNFTGNWYCESGERTVNLTDKAPWEGNIKSIKLIDGASVKIYNQSDRAGNMVLIENSAKKLDADFLNKVVSYRTVAPEEDTVCERLPSNTESESE
ncbi:MAG: hypothetical protein L3J15_08090 [Devosiaceae bacterium]|nr:hypothetical protein [Devosiaceae bacterium]